MMQLHKHFARTAALLLLAALVLLPQPLLRAQQDPLPMPPPPTGEEITPKPSLEQPQPENQTAPLLSDDFENGLALWTVTGDVLLEADAEGNTAARFAPAAALSPVDLPTVSAFDAVLWFNLADEASTLALNFGAGESLSVNSAGVTFTVNGESLAQAEMTLPVQTWLMLSAAADAGVLNVTLNDVPLFDVPVSTAAGVWSIGGANVSIDDVLLNVPAAPVDQPPATLEPPVEVTPLPEPTEEVTPNPEITQEPLPEVTTEVTPEPATPEPTTPPDVDDTPQDAPYDAAKINGALAALLDAYQTGGQAAANVFAAERGITFNDKNRTLITVYGVTTTTADNLRAEIKTLGAWGGIDGGYGVSVEAYLSLEEAAALSLLPTVAGLDITPRLGSIETESNLVNSLTRSTRAAIGNTEPQGYALTGVESWHRAGYRGGVDGNRVRVAVIDVGFGTVTTVDSDLACYRSSSIAFAYPANGVPAAGDTFRGRYMAEIICDVAPQSNVRLYKATTPGQLAGAVNAAVSASNDVIVIGVDLGVNIAAGDGGQNGAASVYTALQNARASGIVVIAAAGNNGQALKTFTSSGSANLTIKVGRGDVVNVGWDGWGDSSNISGTLREGGTVLGTASRTGGGAPGFQIAVPGSCDTDANGMCTLSLELSGGSGKVVQVQALTTRVKLNGDFSYIDNLRVTFNSGGTEEVDSSTIGRPADSPNVIAVGAVCSDVYETPYAPLAYSSNGPIFGPGGTPSSLPAAPFKRGDVKPDLVAASHVDVNSGGGMSRSSDSDACRTGFGGTQAAAAHVGGMAAVLLQNTTNNTFQTLAAHARVKDYFQQRAVDLPLNNADGFDMRFGAGLATLGQPSFDYDVFFSSAVPTNIPNRLPSTANCSGGYIYVGQYAYGSNLMDGSLATPYHSIGQAIKVASATPNTCVIVTGGEYATPLVFDNTLANPVQVYSYASVSRTVEQPATLNVLNASQAPQQGNEPFRYAGVLFKNTSDHTLAGFDFRELVVPSSHPLAGVGPAVVYASPNAKLLNNTFSGFTQRALSPGTALVEIVGGSHGAMLTRNTFNGNANGTAYPPTTPPTYTSNLMLVNVVASGTSASPVKVENNTFSNNVGVLGFYSISDTIIDSFDTIGPSDQIQFYPLVRGLNSYVDFVNNQFTNNQFETLLTVATSRITAGSNADSVYRIFGNAFVNNTARSEDANKLAGPIINLFNAPKTYVVNNTFANNVLKFDVGPFASIIGRGNGVELDFTPSGSISNTGSINNAPFDVHNNLFFRNTLSGSGAIVRDMGGSFGTNCRSNSSVTNHTGATHNFAYRNGPSAGQFNNYGDCGDAFTATPANNNRTSIDPLPLDGNGVPVPGAARYILSDTIDGTSAATAGYYMMIPAIGTGADPTLDGVDAGNEGIVNTLFPQFLAGTDPRGITRRNDGDGAGGAQIDIGAFEYTPLVLTQTDFTYSFNEDSGAFEFNIADFIDGGFPPYRIEITQYPQYYGTANGTSCDSSFTPTARGIVTASLDVDTILLAYCPPRDFHSSSTLVDPDGTRVVFNLRDSTNGVVGGSVQYTVNPVNDSPLTSVIGDNNPVGDLQIVGVALNRTTTVRARPWVDLENNFVFSERGNTLEPALQTQADYTYTYSNIQRISGTCPDGTTSDQTMPLPTLVNGRFVFTLPPSITTSIVTCFSYDATDRNSNKTVGNIMIVNALEEPDDFTLVSPANEASIETLNDLTVFTWNRPANYTVFASESYTLTLTYKGLNDEVILEKTGLTPDGSDDDGLSCTTTLCTYTISGVDRDSLISGQYEWTVTAFNDRLGKEATIAFRFQLSAGEQLIRNGNFEEAAPTRADRARYWALAPNKGTNSRRYCPVATGDCGFAIVGKPNINIVLRQNARAQGDAQDVLTFTGRVAGVKARGGVIQVVVTYINNQQVRMNYRIPQGTYDFRTFQRQITLTNTVKQMQVFVRSNGAAAGRVNVDDLSLVLLREKEFQLLTPINGSSVTTAPDAVNGGRITKMLNRLTWNESEDVGSYALTLKRVLPTEEAVYNAEVFTAAADTDPLTCKNNLCVFNIPADKQIRLNATDVHTYEWNVTAGNGREAQNGPFTFTVRADVSELLYNGFLDNDNNKDLRPDSWTTPGRVSDRLVCNAAKNHRWPAYQGYCSYVFAGKNVKGFNSRLVQLINKARLDGAGVTMDSTLTLRVVASGAQIVDKAARVVAQVTLSNNRVYTIPLIMPKGQFGYTEFVGTLNLADLTLPDGSPIPDTVTLKNVKVMARYTGVRGTFKVDNISLAVDTPPAP